jgi:hypothetical protein
MSTLKVNNIIPLSGETVTLSGSLVTSADSNFVGSLEGTASYALTALYALNGESTDTGSLLVTASVSSNTITFIKGDTTTFDITVDTGSAEANTGDITFEGIKIIGAGTGSGDGLGFSTMELVPDNNLYGLDQYVVLDPTTPGHIHLRAGGAIDNSSAYLYLGGENNNVRISDGSNRVDISALYTIQLKAPSTQFETFYDSNPDWSGTAEWVDIGGGQGQITFNDPSQTLSSLINTFGDYLSISASINSVSSSTVVSWGGGNPATITTATPPATSPTTVTQIEFQLVFENRLRLDPDDGTFEFRVGDHNLVLDSKRDVRLYSADDIELYSQDDLRLEGSDYVALRNLSATEPVRIISDYNDNSHTWNFNADGTLDTPGDVTITGSLTVTSEIAGTLIGTASWSENAQTASYVANAVASVNAETASYATLAASLDDGEHVSIAGGRIVGGVANAAQVADYVAVFGYQNTAGIGQGTLVAGRANTVNGNYSTAVGYINTITSTAQYSFAQGAVNVADAIYSHVEGTYNLAQGPYSHAEGQFTTASGQSSHTEGELTQAIGFASHAEGSQTAASGSYSHAEGNRTIASGSYQHVSGQYNQHNNDTSYFVVGIGLTEETRKDGFTVDVDANGSGSIMIPNNVDAPSVAKTGSMYVDPANNKLWIYTGNGGVSGWVTSSLG